MGIPKFFRWLTRRYPLILQNIKKEEDCPPIDNLYLDLNGIVHNCIHGNDIKKHERVSSLGDFEEVWANIMKAIDEIVHTIKPKQLLFLAVDGVAPRAKMNQQRARRFRSAKDAMLLRQQLESQGKIAPELFDSNAISPGTKFMVELSKQLDFFVQYKINTDPLYKKLSKVILSDGSVPGEGEHKMMDYVRQAKIDPKYNPNTRHCFYGADADLIMLSLITHEPHFMILREEHIVKKIKQGGVQRLDLQRTHNFQLIHISLLREYLHLEYSEVAPRMKMRFDLERIIDDFVFFCFFIGNDFLPSLSALDIGEGSLDQLIDFYKQLLPSMTDYITNAGMVFWNRAQPFIQMLGKHEHEVFQNRISSIEQSNLERIVSWDSDFNQQAKQITDKATLLKNKVQEKLLEKKRNKILQLTQKNSTKKFKKYLLMKKFEEDNDVPLTPAQLKQREDLILKYKVIRSQQYESEKEVLDDNKKVETLNDILETIKEEYFSDLQPNEIPDEHVSDINENDLDLGNVEGTNLELESKLAVAQQITDKYCEQNAEFMREFVKQYIANPDLAKASYYQKKLGFETSNMTNDKKIMLRKYLEGLQWVLYYYYKGVQHWRWYYPYHYAPMISDLGDDLVKEILQGQINIDSFQIDSNCSDQNYPYTPFQQLLSILPTKSIHLLPVEYKDLAIGILEKYFPADFDIDLNGRTLPWEAICLIPFVDEKLFLINEGGINHLGLNQEDRKRNTITFSYKCYKYDKTLKNQAENPLPSSLIQLKGLAYNNVSVTIHDEYKDVGKHAFSSKIHPGAQVPNCDFPSFKWIGVNSIDIDVKVVNRVPMKRILVKIPSCMEEQTDEEFEKYIYKFVSSSQKELYTNFPHLHESFPMVFENAQSVYQIYGDAYTGNYRVHKTPQNMTPDEFESFTARQKIKLADKGILVVDPKAFVIVNYVIGVKYDDRQGVYYKIYDEDEERIPFQLVVKRRDVDHYLNVNQRVSSYQNSLKLHQEVVCLNMHLFGVVGELDKVEHKKGQVKIQFDKQTEQAKIHDPFVGLNVLQSKSGQESQLIGNMKRFYTDAQLEKDFKLVSGVINRLTGSFLVSFLDKQKSERVVFDLGLNIKNYTKKVHIPDYVRYVAEEDYLADNQFDSYQHNFHARGNKHVRKHWEYSQECYDIIKEYYSKYSEVMYAIARTMRDNKQMHTPKDIFKNKDPEEAVAKIKEIAHWIEALPISGMPYVEIGFDALSQDLIEKLDAQKTAIKNNYQKIELNVRESEMLQLHMVYQECFPLWTPPYSSKTVQDFRVGDRVMNINSTKRFYIPFGLRGTVIGKTAENVIILFDEQFLNGSDVYGHCKDYRGAQADPENLINLTNKFQSIIKKNAAVLQNFQEKPTAEQGENDTKETTRVVSYQPEQKDQKQYYQQKNQIQARNPEHIVRPSFVQQDQPSYAKKEQAIQEQITSQPIYEQPSVVQTFEENKEETKGEDVKVQDTGFNMLTQNQSLAQNADFQQLMNMFNVAQQMQGFQLFNPGESQLNVNANEFVPKKNQ